MSKGTVGTGKTASSVAPAWRPVVGAIALTVKEEVEQAQREGKEIDGWRVIGEGEEIKRRTQPWSKRHEPVPTGFMYEAAHAAPPLGNFFGNLLCSLGLADEPDREVEYGGGGVTSSYNGAGQVNWTIAERSGVEVKDEPSKMDTNLIIPARAAWENPSMEARAVEDVRWSVEMRQPPQQVQIVEKAPTPEMPGTSESITDMVFIVHEGYLISGDDLAVETLTLAEAKRKSRQLDGCVGFTFEGHAEMGEPVQTYFKSAWSFAPYSGWLSYKLEETIQVPQYQKDRIPETYAGPPITRPAPVPAEQIQLAQPVEVVEAQTVASSIPTSSIGITRAIVRAVPVAVPITVNYQSEMIPVAVPNVEEEEASMPASERISPRNVQEVWVEPEDNELRALEISSMGEVNHTELMIFVQAIATGLSRGHEAIVKAIFTFFDVQLRDDAALVALQTGKVVRSNFPAFEFRVIGKSNDEIERILVEIDLQRRTDFYWVSYKSRVSWLPSPPSAVTNEVVVELPKAVPVAYVPPPPRVYVEPPPPPKPRPDTFNLNSVFDV